MSGTCSLVKEASQTIGIRDISDEILRTIVVLYYNDQQSELTRMFVATIPMKRQLVRCLFDHVSQVHCLIYSHPSASGEVGYGITPYKIYYPLGSRLSFSFSLV